MIAAVIVNNCCTYWFSKSLVYGLLMTNGNVIAISSITAISEDGKWMDVELLTSDELPVGAKKKFTTSVAGDRRRPSVQIDKIVMAYEIVTS